MNKDIQEHISRLMDDDLSVSEARFLIRRFSRDNEVTQTYSRYQMIGACIRREDFSQSLSKRIQDELNQDNSQEMLKTNARSSVLKYLGGTGIAAAAAMVTFFGVSQIALQEQPGLQPQSDKALMATTQYSQPPVDIERAGLTLSPVAATQTLATSPIRVSKAQLQNYLLRHSQVARKSGQQGVMPYIYVVAGKKSLVSDEDRKDIEQNK